MSRETLSIAEVSKILGLNRKTVQECLRNGSFPRPLGLGCKKMLWSRRQFFNWLDAGEPDRRAAS
jgi:predicted DNA-binding transcriptional regulator AlpA